MALLITLNEVAKLAKLLQLGSKKRRFSNHVALVGEEKMGERGLGKESSGPS